jgi:hypothetical protein
LALRADKTSGPEAQALSGRWKRVSNAVLATFQRQRMLTKLHADRHF